VSKGQGKQIVVSANAHGITTWQGFRVNLQSHVLGYVTGRTNWD